MGPDGFLYSYSNYELRRIDPQTGSGTVVGIGRGILEFVEFMDVTDCFDFTKLDEQYLAVNGAECEEEPQLVFLRTLEAKVVGETVHVKWQTTSELEEVGYRLLRSRLGGDLEEVAPEPIASHGTVEEGGDYLFLDGGQEPGMVRYYLERVDRYGRSKILDRVSVMVPVPVRRLIETERPSGDAVGDIGQL